MEKITAEYCEIANKKIDEAINNYVEKQAYKTAKQIDDNMKLVIKPKPK